MPKSKYDIIYKKLKQKIEAFEYEYQQLLPSEHTLCQEFESSRNTIRRAIQTLAADGYVQSLHGKGVRVIYEPTHPSLYMLGGIESFVESSIRGQIHHKTKVILFSELVVDQTIAKRTSFPMGAEIYYIQRLRYLENTPLILDHNYFLKEIALGITKEIAKYSIYDYLENNLNINITTTKRMVTVEPITEIDETHLELNGCNCVAVISNSTYNDDGIMFEYTQSRHSPKHFQFQQIAQRLKP